MKTINKFKSFVSVALVGGMLLSTTSCKDEFTEINESKTSVVVASPSQLFTQICWEFQANPYMLWFAQAPKFYYAAQMSVGSGSMNQESLDGGAERQGFQAITLLDYKYALEKELSAMGEEEAAKYKNTQAAVDVLIAYLGIFDTDDAGDMPFTEAGQARYGGTLTPKYDRVEDLYGLWLTTLDNAITTFTTSSNQFDLGNQDLIYKGNWSKWAKLANSLKLKIAARLIHQDFPRAKSIASAVVSASCGVLNGEDDDFLYCRADERVSGGNTDGGLDKGDIAFNTSNTTVSYSGMSATQEMVDFLLKNADPRVRFFYTKNSWNSKVVAWFLENGKKNIIPSFILENVETQTLAGVETFKAWKGMGEPWVRYYGLPTAYQAKQETDANNNYVYGEWYIYDQYQQGLPGSKTYRPYSTFNEEMVQGRVDFTIPTAPEGPTITDTDDNPWHGMYLTTAEVNLYLAEFATYGAISGDANEYFQKGVKASVEAYDRLAGSNKIPYYGKTYDYDPNEKVIDLQEGEIEAMLANEDYQLTGDVDADLEKIFLQQLIHFTYQPKDMFVTARRSGVPMFNSTLYPRKDYASNGHPATSIARRSSLGTPQETDLMYKILNDAYQVQGFTNTINGSELNSQRVWQDQGAPQWGEGPNVK